MICGMTTVHVRANQTTVDWAEGAEFVCERTPFVDNLIQHGGLTELEAVNSPDAFETDRDLAYVKYAEGGVMSARDAEEKAAQEDLAEALSDAADTIAELNTELDIEPPKPPRTRRKTS
jgi:hypothetical protein